MTVMEKQYAAELITKAGKVYIYDDAKCLKLFLQEGSLPEEEISLLLLTDFYAPDKLIPADEAIIFSSPALRTPMNGMTVALSDSGGLLNIQSRFAGSSHTFKEWLQ